MQKLLDWLHENVRGQELEIVYITDMDKTVMGLKDKGTNQVFIVGNNHDLTYIVNDKRDRPEYPHSEAMNNVVE